MKKSASLEVPTLRKDRANVLPLAGEIDLHVSPTIRTLLDRMIAKKPKRLVVDLSDVSYIDSAGLGEIVRTYTTVSRQGGSLKLLHLTKRIADLLSITKLLTVFESFEAEADAVRSFSASAKV